MENRERMIERASGSMEKTAETIGDTIIAVLDRLAGKQSDLKLSFEDLTLDTGVMKARVNGAVVLDLVMAKEVEAKA
ncbi:MAG: hypothetical protein ACQCN6_08925 [Candidatus Bathyarchaeia archaeon]|jgi:hypothetical protein